MEKKMGVWFLSGTAFILILFFNLMAQTQISLSDIIEKNFQAAGGLDKINAVKNFSFKDRQTTYFLSSAAQMKITSGKDPVITEVILVDQKSAIRNCFNKLNDFGALLEQTLQIRAKLYSGLFTLLNFQDELEFRGTKRFGLKEFHELGTKTKDLEVAFYIDSKDFLLKRVVFRGYKPDFGKYEVNHDFGPYQNVNGINIPTSWFSSQVGTRGHSAEVSEVNFNLELSEDFFTNRDVNVGKTEYSEGILKGNIVDFSLGREDRIMISTNWTDDCIERAGFSSEDKLILTLGTIQIEVDFYASQPPRSAYNEDTILMMPARGAENYMIYILASGYKDMIEQLEPLMAIQIKKKD